MKLYGSLTELVSAIFRKNSQNITLRPSQTTTYTGNRTVDLPPQDSNCVLVSADSIQTLTNKTISGATNTLTVRAASDITGQLPTTNGGTGVNSTATFPTSGVVVTETATETLSNKTLDNTSTINIKDTLFTIQDDGDTSKQLRFQLSGITTATTRTLTVPDASDTIVVLAATQTLTNKSISGSTNTITNVSLTTGVTGVLPLANGGTGVNAASANAAFNALSPLTTKGDVLTYSTVNARLPVGSDGQVIVADSTQTLGIKWSTNTATALENGNLQTTTGGGTTTLTNSDKQMQTFNSLTSAHTVKLPTTGIVAGDVWTMINPQPYKLTIQSSGANTIITSWGTRVRLQALVSTPTTAGNWAVVEDVVVYGRTWTAYTPTFSNLGTPTNVKFSWRRDGNDILIKGSLNIGTPAGGAPDFSIPSLGAGITIDTANLVNNASGLGIWLQMGNGTASLFPTATLSGICELGGGSTTAIRMIYQAASKVFNQDAANGFLSSTFGMDIGAGGCVRAPITEWNET